MLYYFYKQVSKTIYIAQRIMRHTALWFLESQINDFADIEQTVHS